MKIVVSFLIAIATGFGLMQNSAADDLALRQSVLQHLAQQTQRRFHFVQEKHIAVLKKPLISEGELTLDNNTVIWDIRKPFVTLYTLTPDAIREKTAQGEQIIPIGQNPLAAALTQAMTATLSGQWRDNNTQASIRASGQLQAWQLDITPTAPALQPLIRSMAVSGSNGNIQRIAITESNGDSTIIYLQAHQ